MTDYERLSCCLSSKGTTNVHSKMHAKDFKALPNYCQEHIPIKDHIISCNGGRSLLNKGPFAGVCTDIEDILRHPSRLSVASSIHGYLALFSKHHQIIIQAGLKGAKRGEKDARAFRRRAPGEMEKILVLFSVDIISCLRNSDWVSNCHLIRRLQRQFITALLLLLYT